MASSNACLVLCLALVAAIVGAHAGDPDILSDFVLPKGGTPDANSFTFRGLKRALWGAPPKGAAFMVTKASQVEFSALTGQSVSFAVLQFAAGGVNAPHTHPRAAELLLVVQGSLDVGFVDSNNKLFTQTLKTGEAFVFPKGLVHFQMNRDHKYPTVAISAFGSANAGTVSLPMTLFGTGAGTVSLPMTLFGTGINTDVLAKSFKVDAQTIEKLVGSTTKG